MSVNAVAPHENQPEEWCKEHHPEGCLSVTVQIPGLPVRVWATSTDAPDVIRVIIDGSTGSTHEALVRI